MFTTIPVTLGTAGSLGLIFITLTFNVVRMRAKTRVMLGEGTAPALQVAIRMHGNFAEFVPLALLLLGGIEAAGANHTLVLVLAVMLIVGRVAHPFGLLQPAPNFLRAGGAILTWVMMIVASVTAITMVI